MLCPNKYTRSVIVVYLYAKRLQKRVKYPTKKCDNYYRKYVFSKMKTTPD